MPSKQLLITSFAFLLCSFSGKFKDPAGIQSKTWKKSWARVKQGLWMQKAEVSNAEYKLFLNDLKQNGRLEEWKQFYPDSLVWAKDDRTYQPFVEYYFSNAAYDNYPVVNIGYEAAMAYCNWLTNQYSNAEKQPFGKVSFRLPTHGEWMNAASSGKDDGRTYPWNGLYLHNNRGERLCNFRADSASLGVIDAGSKKQNKFSPGPKEYPLITSPVISFFPNDLGIYNVCGNVAEMIAEKGIAAGGSFEDTGYYVRIQSTKPYKRAGRDLGFRVLMQSTVP